MRKPSGPTRCRGDCVAPQVRAIAPLFGGKTPIELVTHLIPGTIGFFVGAVLLETIGYDAALWAMAGVLAVTLIVVATMLTGEIGKSKVKAPLRSILSKSEAINRLAAARFFLFASRDIWFVVALPVFLHDELGWTFYGVGGFLAVWVIGYGIVQASSPRLLRHEGNRDF